MTQTLTYPIQTLMPYINWIYFMHAWGFAPTFASIAQVHRCPSCREQWIGQMPEEEHSKARAAIQCYDDAVEILEAMALQNIEGVAKVALCPAWSENEDIVFLHKGEELRIHLLRQQHGKSNEEFNYCIADYIAPRHISRFQEVKFPLQSAPNSGHDVVLLASTVGFFATTVHIDSVPPQCDDYRQLMYQTLQQRLAEATAEKMHQDVRTRLWGYAPEEQLSVADLFAEKYVGLRPAIGYPSLPDLSLNFDINRIINMGDIGITLTTNGMMQPAASVSGLLLAHPAARHFSVGAIGTDQLQDYARRKGMSVQEIKRFFKPHQLSVT